MKIAYFGYDFFYRCLEHLSGAGHEVVKVFTYKTDNKYNFNDYIISLADSSHIPVQFSKVTPSDIYNLRESGCELLVVAAYPYKVPILEDCIIKGINIHPTLLPEGRGVWPLPYIILNGLKNSGVTIHKLEEKIDSGDILLQQSFDIMDIENLESLSCKCQLTAVSLLEKLLKKFDFYWSNAQKQGVGSNWAFPSIEQQTINWDSSVHEISRITRAIGKFESRAKFDDKYWVVQDAVVWAENHRYIPGEVVHRTNKEVVIAAKDGLVCLRFFEIDPDPTS
jgi:methionyl-tRNA formyltransferase